MSSALARMLIACLVIGLGFELTAPVLCPAAAAAIDDAAPAVAGREVNATQPAEGREFLRFSDDGKGGGTLDTAIATYENADGVKVHLVAAVHVGEAEYYEGLSDTFDTYDALLYELVKPRDAAAPGPKAQIRGGGAIGGIQRFMKESLKLEFQLESIDYARPNFVHADLDVETFNQKQEEKGESMLRLMIRSMLSEMKRQREGKAGQQVTIFDMMAALKDPDSTRQLKLLLARQFQNLEAQMEGIEGKDGSVIIAERNKAALKVLEKTISSGKTNIGVFYGAGHMSGLDDALIGDMGFTAVDTEWRVAWDMREAGAGEREQKGQ